MRQIKTRCSRMARRNASSWVQYLPSHVANHIIRSTISVPTSSGDLTLKIAHTNEELESAFRLLHASYVDAGLMRPVAAKMRVTKYHLLPTTTIVIAQHLGKTIGTLSIVQEGAFGLPIDKLCPRRTLFPKAHRAAEISALAVDREYRLSPGRVLFPLTKFMWEYADRYLGLDYLFAAVNPKHAPFYEAILLFKRLRFTTKQYDFVNGNPALGEVLDIKAAHTRYQKVYSGKEPARNLYRYYTENQHQGFLFPDRKVPKAFHGGMNPEFMEKLFAEENPLVTLDDYELELLNHVFQSSKHQDSIPRPRVMGRVPVRMETRYPIHCVGTLELQKGKVAPLKVIDASLRGLRAASPVALRPGEEGLCHLRLAEGASVDLRVKLVRNSGIGSYGFKVQSGSPTWKDLLEKLAENYQSAKVY